MTTKLNAQIREISGRKVKKLRADGIIPANVYGKSIKSTSLQLDTKEFVNVYKETGETGLIDLIVDGKVRPVLVHDVQVNPVTDKYIHVDFFQVNLKEKVKSQVPLELVGISPAEKSGIGTVVQILDEIEVEALPADLPEKFEIDISILTDVDQSITVGDIKAIKDVDVLTSKDILIVKVEQLREEEVNEVVEVEVATDEKDTKTENSEEVESDENTSK